MFFQFVWVLCVEDTVGIRRMEEKLLESGLLDGCHDSQRDCGALDDQSLPRNVQTDTAEGLENYSVVFEVNFLHYV